VFCRYNCAYTGADAGFYEPSKELMKKMVRGHNKGCCLPLLNETSMTEIGIRLVNEAHIRRLHVLWQVA
jgi:hypothetical protein